LSAPRRILVGVDGSPYARHAIRWTVGLAEALAGEIVAVHALGLLTHLGTPSVVVPAHEHREEVRALLEGEWSVSLNESQVPHRYLLVDGNPPLALMAAADAEDADLIVVGTRGTGGFPGLQLGSTSHQLVQHSGRPVAVVPSDDSLLAADAGRAPVGRRQPT
jgi:nucleotide-binding universal stress UspA family protein